MELPFEVQRLMGEMWGGIQQAEMDRARLNPEKYKKTLYFGKAPKTYRWWWAGEDKAKTRFWYCVSNFANVAGYFLVWREVRYKKSRKIKGTMAGGKRDQWAAYKNATSAVNLAKVRAERSLKKLTA